MDEKFRQKIKAKVDVLESVALEKEQHHKACEIRDMCRGTLGVLPDLIDSLRESTDEEDQDKISAHRFPKNRST